MEKVQFQFLSNNTYCVFGQHGCGGASLNIYETEHALLILIDLAGTDPESLQIEARPDLLHIQGVRRFDPPSRLLRIHRLEIDAGPFEISIPLNIPIDPEQTRSHYHNGLLEIMLPIMKPSPQRITINVAEAEAEGAAR
jgi:HSP20 family molecular chaperone IbpA